MNMKKLFLIALISGYVFGNSAIAEDSAQENMGEAVLALCNQMAQSANAEDVDAFVYQCIEEKMQYEKDD
jgi:hypothetical protein